MDATGTKMARPTKYTPEIQKKAENYAMDFTAYGDPVPTVAGLADAIDVARSTIYLWQEEHPEFSDTLERIDRRQEKFLISGGLTNEFNTGIAKLMLHNHGYSDRSSTDVTTQGDKVEGVAVSFVPSPYAT